MLTDREKNILLLVAYVPEGRVITYKLLAQAAGNPEASRAVGNTLNKNPWSPDIPCHRVIKSDGKVGGFAQGNREKIKRLEQEGVTIERGKVVSRETIMDAVELHSRIEARRTPA